MTTTILAEILLSLLIFSLTAVVYHQHQQIQELKNLICKLEFELNQNKLDLLKVNTAHSIDLASPFIENLPKYIALVLGLVVILKSYYSIRSWFSWFVIPDKYNILTFLYKNSIIGKFFYDNNKIHEFSDSFFDYKVIIKNDLVNNLLIKDKTLDNYVDLAIFINNIINKGKDVSIQEVLTDPNISSALEGMISSL